MIDQNDRQRPGRFSALKSCGYALGRHLAVQVAKIGAPLVFDLDVPNVCRL